MEGHVGGEEGRGMGGSGASWVWSRDNPSGAVAVEAAPMVRLEKVVLVR